MAYDWRPTSARSATTDPNIVARPRHRAHGASPYEDITVSATIAEFVEAAEAGRALNRSGRPYKPSALRDLRGILEYHVAPELGEARFRDVRRRDVQALVDRLAADQLSESRIRSVISALRALYGYAIEQGHVEFNPADALVMPRADEGRHVNEDRTASWGDRLDEVWEDRPRWEDRPARDRRSTFQGSERRRPDERTPGARRGARRRDRDRAAYEPIALLPDRILSFALRAVLVLFALIVLASLLESL